MEIEEQIKNSPYELLYDKQENDLPPISFHNQPESEQQKYFMYKYSQGPKMNRINTFTAIQQSPQPVEKVIELSDETMIEQKQETQKVERSYSENSMECEVNKKQKITPNENIKQTGNTNVIQRKENKNEINKTYKKDEVVVNQIKSTNTQFTTTKNIQIKSNANQIQITPQMNQLPQQIQQQKSKEKIPQQQSMYNILPNAVQNGIQTNHKEQIQVPNTNKMKVTSSQVTPKTTVITTTNQNTKITKEKKPTKLRFQTCDKKQRPLMPIKSTKPTTDPNMTKRREMIRGLRELQRKCLFTQTKTVTSKTEMTPSTFIRDLNEYCYRNDFFRCEINEKREVIVSCEMFGDKRMNVIFDMNEKNYENWNFPKPKMSDGKEICDKNMLDKMKKQPSVEIFMNELFRIITVCYAKY